MESFLAKIPVHVNPIYGLGIVLTLAYLPHLTKKAVLSEKLKKEGKSYATANSRGLSALMVDDTPLGMKIANIMGCHQNGLEAFAYFSVAMLCSMHAKVQYEALCGASTIFIAIRVMYNAVYLSKFNGPPRTYLFFASAAFTLSMFGLAGHKYSSNHY